MSDSTNWDASKPFTPEIKAYVHEDRDDTRMPAGWWLAPSAILGAMCWAGIFYFIFA